MPRFKTHAIISTVTGASYSLAIQARRKKLDPSSGQSINPLHVVVCALAAFVGGCMPDCLEPASRSVGPNHRGFFHSLLVGIVTARGAYVLGTCSVVSVGKRWLADVTGAFYAGMASHLAADFCSPKGLNFVCKSF